jgi:predicted Zn-dependent protease
MPAAVASDRAFDLEGVAYRWDGWRWRPLEGRDTPPKDVLRRLNHLRMQAERQSEHDSTDVSMLVGLAIRARKSDAAGRAERFARRILALDPENGIAAAILSSVLREKGRPKEALEIAERFKDSSHAAVLTSRAAALCDVKRWGEALEQIERVIQIELNGQGFNSEEALAVHGRIQGNSIKPS